MTSNNTSIRGYFSGGILSYGNRAGINLVNGNIGITIDLVRIATISIYMQGQTTGIRQLQWYYEISFNSKEGLYHIYGGHNVGAKEWNIATGCYLYT